MLQEGYDVKYGARDIGRKFRTCIEPLVADVLLSGNNQKTIEINVNDSNFFVEKNH